MQKLAEKVNWVVMNRRDTPLRISSVDIPLHSLDLFSGGEKAGDFMEATADDATLCCEVLYHHQLTIYTMHTK